jgi:membrane-bound serine protease (ClpP class)
MVLALISMSLLPVNYGGLTLILAGVGMMVAEAFVPAYGVLGIGGLVALVLGSLFLVDPSNREGLRISWYVIAPGAATMGIAFVGLGFLVLRARRAPVRSGREGLIGATGVVLGDFQDGRGQVRVTGAIWSARSTAPFRRGDEVTVTGVRGLELDVTPAAAAHGREAPHS